MSINDADELRLLIDNLKKDYPDHASDIVPAESGIESNIELDIESSIKFDLDSDLDSDLESILNPVLNLISFQALPKSF